MLLTSRPENLFFFPLSHMTLIVHYAANDLLCARFNVDIF
jgi:hypothetical protein